MPRVVGIDPGTVSFDLYGIEGSQVILDRSIPSSAVADRPELVMEALRTVTPLDAVVGPSGYGLALTTAARASERERRLTILVRPDDGGSVAHVLGGLGRLLHMLPEIGAPVYLLPAVIHLPTVPAHRKVNRVDMGTTDKMCVCALAIADQAERLGIGLDETRFVLVELGGAYTAAMAVDGGMVVDGLGGSSGPMTGFMAASAMDGEAAYLLNRFAKELLFTGGAAYVAGQTSPDLADFLAGVQERRPRYLMAWEALLEGVTKAVALLTVAQPRPREVILSGRLVGEPLVRQALIERLQSYAPVVTLSGRGGRAKAAAQGAALLADGLAGGEFAPLVEVMRIRAAAGTSLDHLYYQGAQLCGF